MTTISYAITANDEAVELERLLDQINEHIRPEDEVLVQMDTTATPEVRKVASKYNVGASYEYHRIYASLNNDFATFKNNLKEYCTRDYIIFLDADEYFSEDLLLDLPEIVDINNHIELFAVPRINTVEELTEEHIKKWGWYVNQNGWINYPDAQDRIIKNKKEIRWVNKVHEKIIGALTQTVLPEGYDLIHHKTIEKQEKQNNYYSTL